MNDNIFEFLFSDIVPENLDGEDWDRAGYGKAPKESVKKAYKLQTNIDLNLIQEDETFTVYDAISGIIALGWEKNSDCHINKTVFRFGDSYERVKEVLYKIDNYIEMCYENE